MRFNRYPPLLTPYSKPLKQPIVLPSHLDPSCKLALFALPDNKWFDYSGNGNHGIMTGSVFNAKGRFGPAVFFDGDNDYVRCEADDTLNPADADFTIEAWILPMASKGSMAIAGHINFSINQWGLYVAGTTFYFILRNGSVTGVCESDSPFTIGNWYHLVGRIAGDNMNLFVNSVKQVSIDTFKTDPEIPSNYFYIGRRRGGGDFYFIGLMDEIRFFKRALSDSEILANHEAGRFF